jgi:hypothetical protein
MGSATLGVSLHKNTPFDPKSSDIDLAIVSEPYYSRLLRKVFAATKGHTDLTTFDPNDAEFFKYSTLNGYIDTSKLPR